MDDINYSRYAARVASGEGLAIHTNDHFELRWATIYATAFFYKIFGINDFSSSLYGITTVLLTGYLMTRLLTKAPLWILAVALLLFFLDYHILLTTHRIWPDSGMALLFLGAYYFYLQALAGKKSTFYPVAFSIFIFLAILTKETVILLLPLLLFLLIRDIIKKRLAGFWKPALVFSALLLFGYMLIFRIFTGDWWYRYTILQQNSYDSICNFGDLPVAETLKRIGYHLWNAFLLNGDMIILIFGFCGFLYRSKVMPGKQERELSLALFILLLSSNFMTISFESYVPLCQDPRHFIFLIPFAAISGSCMLKEYFENPHRYLLVPLFFAGATITIFATGGGEMKYIYFLIGLILLTPVLLKRKDVLIRYSKIAPFLLAACLLIRPLYDLYSNKYYYFEDHKKLVTSTFSNEYRPTVVFSGDELTAELGEYFLGFNTGLVKFSFLAKPDTSAYAADSIYFLLNTATNSALSQQVSVLLDSIPEIMVHVKEQGPVILYRLKDAGSLDVLRRFAQANP